MFTPVDLASELKRIIDLQQHMARFSNPAVWNFMQKALAARASGAPEQQP